MHSISPFFLEINSSTFYDVLLFCLITMANVPVIVFSMEIFRWKKKKEKKFWIFLQMRFIHGCESFPFISVHQSQQQFRGRGLCHYWYFPLFYNSSWAAARGGKWANKIMNKFRRAGVIKNFLELNECIIINHIQ